MKSLKSTLWAFAISMAATLSIVGCDKKPNVEPPVPAPDPANAVVLSKAQAIFMGDEYEQGNGHFMLISYSDGVTFEKQSWKLKGTGEFLWIDFLALMPKVLKNPDIAEGEYSIVEFETSYNSGDAYAGFVDSDGGVSGSFYATLENDNETIDLITDGKMYVTRVGDNYKIVFMMTTKSGKELVYKYENSLSFITFGVPVPPDPFNGTFTSGLYMYFDDYYKVDCGNGMIELSDIPSDVEFGAGHILGLDITIPLISSQKNLAIPAGQYSIDDSKTYNKPMTFNAGVKSADGKELSGSYWVDINSEGGDHAVYAVTGGSFAVTNQGNGKFKVVANVTLEDGTTREGTFDGQFRMNDESCLSRMEGDVELTNLTRGAMVYRGIDIEYTGNNSANWAVVLATEGIDPVTMKGEGKAVLLDINTPKENVKEIPVGSFTKIKQITNAELKPMTYIPGYFDNLRKRLVGTWYLEDLNSIAPAVDGTIQIEKAQNGDYKITFDLIDDYHYVTNGNKIKGSYSGTLSYLDATPPKQVPAFFSRASTPVDLESVVVKGHKHQYKASKKSSRFAYGR